MAEPLERPRAAVMHADVAEEAERVRQRIESRFHCVELFVSSFTPAMGTHTGPELLDVAFWAEGANEHGL